MQASGEKGYKNLKLVSRQIWTDLICLYQAP